MEEHLKQVYQKVTSFCAYQERTHEEVRKKLDKLFVEEEDAEWIISQLIRDNFLNEERFAHSFAGGKFRIKKWGRKRILFELKQKLVGERNIQSALNQIDLIEYKTTLRKLAEKKLEAICSKEKTEVLQKKKLVTFLIQKGYEQELVWALVDQLFGKTK